MSDLFHDQVPDAYIEAVAKVMVAAKMAHLSGSDQAFRQAMQAARFKIEFCGKPAAYLVGRQRRRPKVRTPASEGFIELSRNCSLLSVEPLLEDLGPVNLAGIDWIDRWRRERPRRSSNGQRVGLSPSKPVPQATREIFFKQWGGFRLGKMIPNSSIKRAHSSDEFAGVRLFEEVVRRKSASSLRPVLICGLRPTV